MTKPHRNKPSKQQPEAQSEQAAPQTGVQVMLILNGQQAGGQFMPLPETYAQAEAGLRDVFTSLRDVLARLYEDRAMRLAVAEKQRADALQAQLDALQKASEPEKAS